MSTERPDDARPVDDAVDQAWRAASDEGPSPRIDAAILAAARVEAARAHERSAEPVAAHARAAPAQRRNRWASWQPLAAAATVAGLAFVLVQTMPRDRDVAPPLAVEEARPEATAPSSTTHEARDAGSAPAEAESRTVDQSRAPTAPVPPPPPAAGTVTAPLEAPTESTGAPPAAASAGSRDELPSRSRAAAPAPAPGGIAAQAERELGESPRAMKSATYSQAPEIWATRVEELYSAGERAAAAEELRAFRAAHADADLYLPETLRGWARTVE